MNKTTIIASIMTSAFLGYAAGKSHVPAAIPHVVEAQAKHSSSAPDTPKVACADEPRLINSTVSKNIPHISAANASENSLSAQNKVNAIKAEYEIDKRSGDFSDWLTKKQIEKPWFDLGLEMLTRFNAEEIDYSWANAEENELQDLFYSNPALSEVALKSTTCKSTQCQVVIGVIDQEHANEVAMTVSQELGSNKLSQIIIDNRVQKGEAFFYVSRSEAGFELN